MARGATKVVAVTNRQIPANQVESGMTIVLNGRRYCVNKTFAYAHPFDNARFQPKTVTVPETAISFDLLVMRGTKVVGYGAESFDADALVTVVG